jgi:predicted nuclease of predicted toxin-antitoxin system
VKLLADENIEAACVAWLRGLGHDVSWAVEAYSGCADASLLDIAETEFRIILTRDRGFGEIVYAERRHAPGVILVRLKARNQWERLALLQSLWGDIEAGAAGNFIVATNDRIRVRPLQRLR